MSLEPENQYAVCMLVVVCLALAVVLYAFIFIG